MKNPKRPIKNRQTEEYRIRSFERCGLYDVAVLSAALRQSNTPRPHRKVAERT